MQKSRLPWTPDDVLTPFVPLLCSVDKPPSARNQGGMYDVDKLCLYTVDCTDDRSVYDFIAGLLFLHMFKILTLCFTL